MSHETACNAIYIQSHRWLRHELIDFVGQKCSKRLSHSRSDDRRRHLHEDSDLSVYFQEDLDTIADMLKTRLLGTLTVTHRRIFSHSHQRPECSSKRCKSKVVARELFVKSGTRRKFLIRLKKRSTMFRGRRSTRLFRHLVVRFERGGMTTFVPTARHRRPEADRSSVRLASDRALVDRFPSSTA